MKKRFPKLFTREFIEIIFIPIIAVLSSYIVSVVQAPLSFGQVLATFIAVLILVSVMHVIALKTSSKRIENILHERAEEICEKAYQKARGEIRNTLSDIGAEAIERYEEKRKESELLGEKFFSIDKLREIESSGFWEGRKIISVSCLTSTLKYLENESINYHSFIDIVKQNLKKGIKYTYFYENNSANTDLRARLCHDEVLRNIEYIEIPSEQFLILVDDLDFTLYELEGKDEHREEICVMSTAAYIERSPYHVIASQALTDRISRVLTSLKKQYAL